MHGFIISFPFRKLHFLLEDANISSKNVFHNGSKKKKRSYGKVKNNETMWKIFIRIIYLKQQRNILCFRRLKIEKSLFMIVHTAGKDQIKYFAKN